MNLINQAGGMAQVPPYLVNLRPVIKLEGRPVANEPLEISMAKAHDMRLSLHGPSGSIELNRKLIAGTYLSLVLGTQDDEFPQSPITINQLDDETLPIRLMHNLGIRYNQQWAEAENEMASLMGQTIIRPIPSVAIIAPEYAVDEFNGIPIRMRFMGVSFDAVSRTVDAINEVSEISADWMRLAALQGSYLESEIFGAQWDIEAISADQGLRIQSHNGEVIHEITQANQSGLISGLNHPEYVKSHVQSWVDGGHHVLIGQNPTQKNAWIGSTWYIWHPETGQSGFFISGGYAGGQTTEPPNDWELGELNQMLSAPYAEGANEDPNAGRKVVKIEATDQQYGVVNQALPMPSQVLVTDAQNRPVIGAQVLFSVVGAQAQLQSDSGLVDALVVQTNQQGIAEVQVMLDQKLRSGPLVRVNPSDENLTQLGLVEIQFGVNTNLGFVAGQEPFNHYAIPDQPTQILVNDCHWQGLDCVAQAGQQEMHAGNVYVAVVDQFNNPVPNTPITITADTPIPQASINKSTSESSGDVAKTFQSAAFEGVLQQDLLPAENVRWQGDQELTNEQLTALGFQVDQTKAAITGRCDAETPAKIAVNSCHDLGAIDVPACADTSAQLSSDLTWQTFSLYNGKGYPATRFPVTISSAGLVDVTISRLNGFEVAPGNYAPAGIVYMGDNTNGPNGDYFGAEPEDSVNRQIKPYYLSYTNDGTPDGCDFVQRRLLSSDSQETVSVVGNAELTIGGFSDDWVVNYAMGEVPTLNINTITNDDVVFESVGVYPGQFIDQMTVITRSATVQAELVGRIPQVFDLNDEQATTTRSIFTVLISPPSFQPTDLTANFYADSQLIHSETTHYPGSPVVDVTLPAGTPIDVDKNYFIELVMNSGTEFEIKHEKETLEGLSRRLISAVNCESGNGLFGACGGPVINNTFDKALRLSTSLDLANAAVCRLEGITIDLVTASQVTIDAYKHDVNGVPTNEIINLITDESLPAGANLIPARAEMFGNHTYSLRIRAVADDNGDEDEAIGTLVSTYDIDNSLPIGHAVVKGVDLADGSMIYSKQDIALQAPGADLEFTRTYSSIGRHELGPLGYGWSYNFMSRVMVGNCGQVIVTGADGGSARFRIQGDQFIPLKGHHSSLIYNDDGSFDFYPKGGNRYHYVQMQEGVWWMDYIEDPNGNRLDVQVQFRNNVPIITAVTDAVGRRFNFTYELRDFGIYRHEMLINVSGPEGISLSFDYDELGNLIRAEREGGGIGGTTNEVMTYSGDLSGPTRSLLLSVTDQASGATRSWLYNAKNTAVPPSIDDVPDVLGIEVASITESDAGTTAFTFTPGLGYNAAATVNQNSQESSYSLNSYGAATQITSPAGTRSFVWETGTDVLLLSETDENDRVRAFEYDEFGNITEERLGTLVSNYTYHAPDQFDPPFIKDRIKTHSNWRGFTTEYGYDLNGNKVSEELDDITVSYAYDDRGQVIAMTDGRGLTSQYTYDAFGHQKSQRNPAGETINHTWDARGNMLSETDAKNFTTTYSYDLADRLVSKNWNGLWTYEYQNGGLTRIETDPNNHSTTHTYDTQGRLLSTTNAATDTFSHVYDLNGNKTSENNFGGHETTFEYNDANRLITKNEPLGKVTTYTYDGVGNVLSETTADRITEYTYDPNRYFQTSITRKSDQGDAIISRTVDGHGNVLTETDPNQNQTTFTYDAFDRLLTASGPLGSGQSMTYDANGNVTEETTYNSTGNQTTTKEYDLANRLSRVTLPEGGVLSYTHDGNGNIKTETKPNGYHATYDYSVLNLPVRKTINQQTWRLEYDSVGNLITERWPVIGGQTDGNVITYAYDVLNREISRTDTMGLIQAQTHDANSNLKTLTDGNGELTTYEYNALDQRTAEIKPEGRGHTYTYNVFGDMLTDTGPNGTITHQMDQLGRRIDSSGPDDYFMAYGYDLNGNLTSQTDSRNITTSYLVNALNHTYQQTQGNSGSFVINMSHDTLGNVLSHTDYRGIVTEFTYDLENRQTSVTRAGQLQSTTTYNQAGLPVIVTDANGNNTVHEYNTQYHKTRTVLPESQVIVFTPNAFGDVELQNNPGPNDITKTYDLRRRLKTEANGAGETTRYEYDLNNNRTAVIKPGGQRWEYDFDAANRLTHVRNVPESIETVYQYDTADNLETITDAEQKVTTFTYDNRNRKTSKTYPGGTDVESYGYDKNGNLASVELANGDSFSFHYDELNRQISQSHVSSSESIDVSFTLDGNGNIEIVTEIIEGVSSSIHSTFDELNRITLITDHHGNTLQFAYDSNGNRKTLQDPQNNQSKYTYDDLNRLSQAIMVGTGAFDYIYNSAGLLEGIKYPNNGESKFIYDSANRIDVITNFQMGVPVATFNYEYDLNGNRTQVTQSNISANEVINYSYDHADRLIQVAYPHQSVDYILDKVGNRITESVDNGGGVVSKTFTHNNRDQIISITDTNGLNVSFSYDATGNRTEKNINGDISIYNYTPRQRIKSIISGGSNIEYKYDYLGNRIKKVSNGQTRFFTYDGTSLLFETNNIGNVIAKYHYGSDRVIAETRSGSSNFLIHDALRTPIAITRGDGSIQNRIEYDVWGNQTNQSNTDENPFGFTGYQQDEDTGLYYAKARYYDPVEGVFLREDPLQGDISNPPSLHRYNYAASNPTFYIDPTGLANDTSHYYEALLIGKLVGLNEGQMYAYALGAQIGDEFKHHDAINNSSGYAFEQVLGPIFGFAELMSGSEDRINKYINSGKNLIINNCGAHALCGVDPEQVREAVSAYTFNVADNFAQIGTADHTNTDSFFHIEKQSLNSDDQKSHTFLKGHLFEMKSTDKSYLYHESKRKQAFKARAWLLFKYTQRQGSQKMSRYTFRKKLNAMLADLDDLNESLYNDAHAIDIPKYLVDPQDLINDDDEFVAIRKLLSKHGINNVPRTEDHDLGENIYRLLNNFSDQQLKLIAHETLSKNEYQHKDVLIRTLSRRELIRILNDAFNNAQYKSKIFIYNHVKNSLKESDTVMENEKNPGSKEVSK
ncbi:RHS repeat domain-containing protein [Marinicella meishanensis]|uniref:RHS repeat domain-containing protein n=1 Tax=Marinicella meishanensis TaxID=2873263 RepID=UPI001CBF330C|nr:RHS repeat-associated core domain-containing protein [Marinicella sp. NBU2979]